MCSTPLTRPVSARWAVPRAADSPAQFDRFRPCNSTIYNLMDKLLTVGIDLYAYVTFTTPSPKGIVEDVRRFADRLQTLDENLPLRTVPLEIQVFTPVKRRLDDTTREALKNQHIAVEAWQKELESRYSSEQRTQRIADVPLRKYGGQ